MAKEDLTKLLSQLNVQSLRDEHAEVEETTLKLLERGCTNPVGILRQCLVSLIKQDKYRKVLDVLHKYHHIQEMDHSAFVLERLYTFYKLNMTKEFETLLSSNSCEDPNQETNRGILHVRAQFYYKNGEYEKAFELYQYLSKHNDNDLDNETELACNERVPVATMPSLMTKKALVNRLNEESYDMLFNEAIIETAKQNYSKAEELLQKALSLAAIDDMKKDMMAIRLQLSYIYQIQGVKKKHCKTLLKDILHSQTENSSISLLVKLNLYAFHDFSKYTDNLNLVTREMNIAQLNSKNLQEFTYEQWNILNTNYLLLQLFNNSSIQAKSSLLSRTISNYRKLVDNVNLETYQTQAKKLYHFAVKSIKSGIAGSVIGIVLLAVQLNVIEKQWDRAIKLCEMFFNRSSCSKEQNVIITILFQLYDKAGRDNSKKLLLSTLSQSKNHFEKELPLWENIGFQYLMENNNKRAEEIFKKLVEYKDTSAINHKLLHSVLSKGNLDLNKAKELTSNVKVKTLIAAGVSPLESKKSQPLTLSMNKVEKKRTLLKKKQKKAKKLKKFLETHDLSEKPDPERWIPLRDRSTYRIKKRSQSGKQTQGGAVNRKAERQLDISKKAVTKKPKSKKKKGMRK